MAEGERFRRTRKQGTRDDLEICMGLYFNLAVCIVYYFRFALNN